MFKEIVGFLGLYWQLITLQHDFGYKFELFIESHFVCSNSPVSRNPIISQQMNVEPRSAKTNKD